MLATNHYQNCLLDLVAGTIIIIIFSIFDYQLWAFVAGIKTGDTLMSKQAQSHSRDVVLKQWDIWQLCNMLNVSFLVCKKKDSNLIARDCGENT